MNIGKWFEPKAGAISSLMAPHYFASDQLVLTKSGDLFGTFQCPGIDAECWTDETLESITSRLHTAVRNLPAEFRVYRHVIKRKGVKLDYHRATCLYSIDYYVTLVYEPKSATRGQTLAVREQELGKAVVACEIAMKAFQEATASFLGLVRLKGDQVFDFLNKLTFSNGKLQFRDHLDYWMAREPILVHQDSLTIGEAVQTLTLRQLPRTTHPNLFAELVSIPCDMIICEDFKRLSTDKSDGLLSGSEDNFFHKKENRSAKDAAREATKRDEKKTEKVQDEAAISSLSDLGKIRVRVKNQGEFIGEYGMTIVLRGDDLPEHAAKAINIVGNVEGAIAPDGAGTLDAYLAIVPGNSKRNMRKQWICSMNYADLSMLFGPPVGSPVNKHLKSKALAILETNWGTPYYFNAHESDLLGVLILGIPGSGKSFLTNLIADNSQKNKPFTFIMDVGGSYKQLAITHGGTFIALSKRRGDFTINPFAGEKTEDKLDFLVAFIHVLLSQSGYEPTPKECQIIDAAVKTAGRLRDLNLPQDLMDRLYNWYGTGRYAYLFDNEQDTLSLSNFQAFDFQGVNDRLMEPLFFYLFHKISEVVYDPQHISRPKEMICDEVWKLLGNKVAQEYIIEAGKTWRKHNGGIILTTQSALDIDRVGLLDAVSEMCPTKILLANPGADIEHYSKIFKLNSKEEELFKQLTPKRQFLLKTPMRSAVLSVMPTQAEIWRWSNDPNTNIRRNAVIKEHGQEKAMSLFEEMTL